MRWFSIFQPKMYLIYKGIWSLWVDSRICHNITLLIALEEQKSIYDKWRAVLVPTTAPFSLTHNWENCYCSSELGSVMIKNFTKWPFGLLLFYPSLGVLQNLRPAVVCLWVSQEVQGDQDRACESLRNTWPKPMSPNAVWQKFGYKCRNTLIALTVPVEAALA